MKRLIFLLIPVLLTPFCYSQDQRPILHTENVWVSTWSGDGWQDNEALRANAIDPGSSPVHYYLDSEWASLFYVNMGLLSESQDHTRIYWYPGYVPDPDSAFLMYDFGMQIGEIDRFINLTYDAYTVFCPPVRKWSYLRLDSIRVDTSLNLHPDLSGRVYYLTERRSLLDDDFPTGLSKTVKWIEGVGNIRHFTEPAASADHSFELLCHTVDLQQMYSLGIPNPLPYGEDGYCFVRFPYSLNPALEASVSIGPNPFAHTLHIEIESTIQLQALDIFDLMGRGVVHQAISPDQRMLDLSLMHLPTGP
ncbi:MAG: hypothetical protein AAFV07_12450, partial [Bacteroidota bacterium]